MVRLGILSDTHGLLRPEVPDLLAGSDFILHGGDVGDPAILQRLGRIAPVWAVRGNTDTSPPLTALPFTVTEELEDDEGPSSTTLRIFMVHRQEDVAREWLRGPQPAGPRLIVFGHSHRPELEWRGRCLLLNPGACGHPRFTLPLTVARVTFQQGRIEPEILTVPRT
ncbi:MAG: metallophosphoesterase family protein [Acidobacteriota bacterium]|nr:metallophosphoesterase family protein [Acidobacteriota bacterium]